MIKLNRRIATLKHSATLAADARAMEMKAAGIDVIPLAAGEPDFDTPERIKEAARRALAEGKTKYTAVGGIPELKDAIRLKLKRENGLDYERVEVLVSAGCKQAEANVIGALFDEGDEVIIPGPAWVSFSAMVSLSGATPKLVVCPEENGFLLDPDLLRRAVTPRTRGIILNSPSNPTGAVYSAGHLNEISRVLLDADMWVLSDDVYEHIVYDGPIPHIFQIEPRLKAKGVVLNSLSKAYAMTGWRIGLALAPGPVAKAMAALQSHTTTGANHPAQFAAAVALGDDQVERDVARMVAEFRKRRDVVVARFRQELPGVEFVEPLGAFYFFFRVDSFGRITGTEFCTRLVTTTGVALVPGAAFGDDRYVRLSYAASLDNIQKALDRIIGFAKKLAD